MTKEKAVANLAFVRTACRVCISLRKHEASKRRIRDVHNRIRPVAPAVLFIVDAIQFGAIGPLDRRRVQ